MPSSIILKKINKSFDSTLAVRDCDLTVPEGALCGLIGPNGAGKTTMIRLILGILFPDSGQLSVLGQDSALKARDRIGYLPEERGVYRKMRVGEFLVFAARIRGMQDSLIRREMRCWLERVELAGVENKRFEELSKGMQQKIQFITAVIHRPDLLILDEPFSGLDPVNQRLLRELVLEERRRGATVLFSTHIMQHAEQLCDHVVMMHRGAKVLDGRLPDILQARDSRQIYFEPLDPGADAEPLGRVPGVLAVEAVGSGQRISVESHALLQEVIPALVAAVTPAHIEMQRQTLEEVFIRMVSSGAAGSDMDSLRAGLRAGAGAEFQEERNE